SRHPAILRFHAVPYHPCPHSHPAPVAVRLVGGLFSRLRRRNLGHRRDIGLQQIHPVLRQRRYQRSLCLLFRTAIPHSRLPQPKGIALLLVAVRHVLFLHRPRHHYLVFAAAFASRRHYIGYTALQDTLFYTRLFTLRTMELCLLLAVAHTPAFIKFLIILVLLLIAVPTMAAVFTAYNHSQRRRHLEELEKERDRAEIMRLTAEVSAARAATHRIGYALHDRVGNRVSALSTDLHLLEEHPEDFSPALAAMLCESILEIKDALRDAASTFSGHALHESGLVAAMQVELKRLEKSS